MGVLEHVGRRSGRAYRTPLTVFTTGDGVAILLTYGPDRDWLKNITAAGGGRLRRHGHSFAVAEPRVMRRAEAAPHIVGPGRMVFSRLPFDHAVLMKRAG